MSREMKKKRKITIKFQLHATAFGVVLILLILALSISYYIDSIFTYNDILKKIDFVNQEELELRKAEKDFLLKETTNLDFYRTRESSLLDTFYTKIDNITALMFDLRKTKLVQQMDIEQELTYLASYFHQYKGHMNSIALEVHKKGFKDYGLIGQMRNEIHQFEEIITKQQNADYKIHMLMLRRHEKDYLLRKDTKYLEKFNQRANKFLTILETNKPSGYRILANKLRSYQATFIEVSEKDKVIGLVGNQGHLQDLNIAIKKIESTNRHFKIVVNEHASGKISEAFFTLILLTFILSSFIVFLILRLTRYIIRSIAHLQKYITRLGLGELPEKITATKNDEITEMTDSINVLTANLRNTRDFAIEVGKGNLRTQINVFNNKGDLGGALIEMRNQLEKVGKEQKKVAQDRENRAWINEGIADFSELLRSVTDSVEELSSTVLNKLLTHIDALQGAIYILDDDSEESSYHQKAAVAVNGRKVDKIRINPSEDLLGRAVQLKEIIHLKKIPGDYMKIESALGNIETQGLLIAPLITYNQVVGIIELGTLRKFDSHQVVFVERLAKDLARAVNTVKANIRTKRLLAETQLQASDLQERQEEILLQRTMLQQTNQNLNREKELTAQSIRYAQTIQNSILPSLKQLDQAFSEFFLIFRPRDIVSGDYYWFTEATDEKSGQKIKILAVVDCTGHGVPGAFMSLIGHSVLNQIVLEGRTHDPAQILNRMNEQIRTLLKQDNTNSSNNDGMDVAICTIIEKGSEIKVQYAGAKRTLYYLPKGTKDILKQKGDRSPIGGGRRRQLNTFTSHQIQLPKGSVLYMTTDGYTDQNNETREKFGSRKFINALQEVAPLPLPKQQLILERALDMFQGGALQRDDITVVGVRL